MLLPLAQSSSSDFFFGCGLVGRADEMKRKRKRYECYTLIYTQKVNRFIKDLSSLLMLFALKPELNVL